MKQLVFGKATFNRTSIPDQLRNTSTWPSVDHTALPEQERAAYLMRCRALQAFLDEPTTTIAEILRETGVARSALYRQLDRCWERHEDGRIFGFRALVPYARLKQYERKRAVDAKWDRQGGTSGAFTQLLRDHPALMKLLDKFARQRNSPIRKAREVRKPLRLGMLRRSARGSSIAYVS